MYTLATPDQLRSRLGLTPADNVDEERLWRALTAASARIEGANGRHFTPRLATLAHDLRDARELTLADDLLQLQRLTNGDGREIDLGAVQTLPAATEGSASVLRLGGAQRFVWSGSPLAAIQVTGIWGWHERWSLAWQSGVDSLQDDPLAASATMLHAADSSRFEAGQLLRLEDEYLRLLAIDEASHSLRVLRAAQGTAAVAHSRGTPVDIYQPPRALTLLCLRLALWLYREPDRNADAALPADLVAEMDGLRRDSALA